MVGSLTRVVRPSSDFVSSVTTVDRTLTPLRKNSSLCECMYSFVLLNEERFVAISLVAAIPTVVNLRFDREQRLFGVSTNNYT